MVVFNLRDYQLKVYMAVKSAWQRCRSVLAVVPTGGGKTVIFSKLIHDHSGYACAVVHRKEIISQISLSLANFGVKHRIVAPPAVVAMVRRKHLRKFGTSFVDQTAKVGVASVQTLSSKSTQNNRSLMAFIEQVTLAVFDEGHHYVKKGVWAKAVELFAAANLLFVSATPERADGTGLGVEHGGFAEEMVMGPTTQWLIEQGFLSKFKYKAPESDLNVQDIAVGASGDFNAKALRARAVESHIVGDTVGQYMQHGEGGRAIVFATDVETAEETAEAFRKRGIRAQALSGETDDKIREKAIEDFEAGKLDVLVNCDLFDEGFDVPAVSVVILARPTQSLGKYLQMVGRGLRVQEGKEYAIVIDMVRNWERHGAPNWPRVWSLAGKEKGSRSDSSTIPQRQCAECTTPYPAYRSNCPLCGAGYEPVERGTPKQVDGNLFDLDVDALAALFAQQQAAELDADDYAAELYKPNEAGKIIPPKFHGQAIKRHQAAKYRRGVLRNLVGWWTGTLEQYGRTMPEIHRIFYYRFGIDIGTAFTLDVKQTDELINKIQKNYTKDLNNDFDCIM